MTYQDQNREHGDEYESGTFSLGAVPLEPDTRNDDGDRATIFSGLDVSGNNEMRERWGMSPIPSDAALDLVSFAHPHVAFFRLPAAGPTWDTPKMRRVA